MAQNFKDIRQKLIDETKRKIRESLNPDYLAIQAIQSIWELDKIFSTVAKRLREWYELYNPEFSKSEQDHEKFFRQILEKSREELFKKININEHKSMGANLSEEDIAAILNLAKLAKNIVQTRKLQEEYLSNLMQQLMPNVKEVAGVTIGAKLLSHAGSLEKLSKVTASTIQLYGAEKALFRHMRSGARCPKYGVIHEHPLVMASKQSKKGRVARLIADKISIAAKVDFFKGEFIGDKLKKEIEGKI